MKSLAEYRTEIDTIDTEIVRLLEKRMEVSTEIAAYKKQAGRPVLDAAREEEKLAAVSGLAHGEWNQAAVRELYVHIMALSRKKQESMLMTADSGEKRKA